MKHSKLFKVISTFIISALMIVSPPPFCLEASAYDGDISTAVYDTDTDTISVYLCNTLYGSFNFALMGIGSGYSEYSHMGGGQRIAGTEYDMMSSYTGTITPTTRGVYYYFWSYDDGFHAVNPTCIASVFVPKLSCDTPEPIITKASSTSATVSWNAITGASLYTVYYGTTPACSSSTTVFDTSYTISGVTAGSTVYAKVIAIGTDSYNNSSPSSVVSVSLLEQLATPSPSISSPSLTSLKVSWSSISNASSYTIEYATNSSFSSASSTTTTSRSTTISGLSAGTTYYFRVKAMTTIAGYSNSAWSSIVQGTTTSIITLSPPTPSVTANSQTQITISWSDVFHASSYTVAYGTTSACSSGSFTVTGTSKSITGLSANTTYYVKVMTNTSEAGYTSSGYSSVKSITTPKIVLGTPVLNTITVTNSSVLVIEFDKVSNATQYIIEYATSSDFSNTKTMTLAG